MLESALERARRGARGCKAGRTERDLRVRSRTREPRPRANGREDARARGSRTRARVRARDGRSPVGADCILGSRPSRALARAEPARQASASRLIYGLVRSESIEEPGAVPFVVDYVEALIELGRSDEARAAARLVRRQRTTARARRRRSPTARAVAVCSPAQAGDLDGAIAAFEDALELHVGYDFHWTAAGRCSRSVSRSAVRSGVARRARRSSEALAVFEEIGAALWAERARAELKRISGRAATPGRAHAGRGARRGARRRGQDEQGGRRGALPVRPHRRGPPRAHLREARDPASHRACRRSSNTGDRCFKHGGLSRFSRAFAP